MKKLTVLFMGLAIMLFASSAQAAPGDACNIDADCNPTSVPADLCVIGSCSSETSTCVETDKDCGGLLCDSTDGACVECLSNTDCSGTTPICDANVCVECLADGDCPDGTCDGGVCVPDVPDDCAIDEDCADGICESGVCVPAECEINEDCANGICDSGRCVPECEIDADCADGICESGACVPAECEINEDCSNGICDSGRCIPDVPDDCVNNEDCPFGTCDSGVCIPGECDRNADCPGGICTYNGVCAPCATRTLGFWKTHCAYARHIFEDHLGGVVDLGCIKLTSIEEVLGLLNGKAGKAESELCRAQTIAGKQVAAAILNSGLENAPSLAAWFAPIEIIGDRWCNGTPEAILNMGESLDNFNNWKDEGDIVDSHSINPEAPATPKECKRIAADIDCIGEEEAVSIASELSKKEMKKLWKAQKKAMKAQKKAAK